MQTFIHIISNILLPIFILIFIGFLAQKKLEMEIKTLSRFNIYLLIPAVLFVRVYEVKVSLYFISIAIIYLAAVEVTLLLSGELISRALKYPQNIRKAFGNSVVLFNSGNYGVPLIELVFKGNAVTTTAQLFVMLIQNIIASTFGVFQASSGRSTCLEALKNVLRMPLIYTIIVVFIVKLLGVTVPEQILLPLKYISSGFIGIALITLGAQLAEIKVVFRLNAALLSSFIRLLLSPVIGFLFIFLLGIQGDLAKALVISVSTPSSVNAVILAKEFDNEPEFTSQAVLISTVLSPITVTVVIFTVSRLFW